jgi:hypothetical protein
LIERRDPYIIKAVLTMVSAYRIMPARPELKLETITSPFKGRYTTSPEIVSTMEILRPFLPKERKVSILGDKSLISPASFLEPIVSSGPNAKIAAFGYLLDAFAFSEQPELLESFRIVSKYLGKDIYRGLVSDIEKLKTFNLEVFDAIRKKKPLTLGALALKVEAAGKVRVFAIVDAWTQSLLKPLHNLLFEILRNIPQDGTFDQYAPLRLLVEKKLPYLGSFDLSAATDRLPIDLQVDILSSLFCRELGENWKNLLVGRKYFLSKTGESYSYAVGQPMGALSSWAMLALTHHIIIQTAARRAGFRT